MNDLRKAAEMALGVLLDPKTRADEVAEEVKALRQALAHEALDRMVAENQRLGLYDDGPAVKSYAGGKPNYCTPEETPEVTGEVAGDVDAVNMSQERVDETAKGEHEPMGWLDSEGRFSYFKHLDSDEPLYTAPPKRDSSSWVGLTDDEIDALANEYLVNVQEYIGMGEYISSIDGEVEFARAIEAKLKEKNGG